MRDVACFGSCAVGAVPGRMGQWKTYKTSSCRFSHHLQHPSPAMDLHVLPCLDDAGRWRERVLHELEFIPEACVPLPFVLGGFGALGHPSTFHMDSVRELRMLAYRVFYKHVYEEFYNGYQVEALIDRLMVRPSYRKPTAEAWHRDIAKGADGEDVVFGGWINLDDTDQYFSYLPGSTCANVVWNKGFALVTPEEKAHAISMKQVVAVPPGHVLFFNETLVHEVVSQYRDDLSVRLFVGARVSPNNGEWDCLHDRMIHHDPPRELLKHQRRDNLLTKILTGAIIPLKSGQLPAMYPKLTWSNKVIYNELTVASRSQRGGDHAFQNVSLTESLSDKWLEWRKIRAPGSGDTPMDEKIAPMFCSSLASCGHKPPIYSSQDIAILYPHTREIQ